MSIKEKKILRLEEKIHKSRAEQELIDDRIRQAKFEDCSNDFIAYLVKLSKTKGRMTELLIEDKEQLVLH